MGGFVKVGPQHGGFSFWCPLKAQKRRQIAPAGDVEYEFILEGTSQVPCVLVGMVVWYRGARMRATFWDTKSMPLYVALESKE